MTPEQERMLFHVAGTVERIDERTEAFERWSLAHEKDDDAARKDIASLIKSRTKATTTARVLFFVAVSISTAIGWLIGFIHH